MQLNESQIICCAILAIACVTDLWQRKIYNCLTIPACVTGIVYHGLNTGLWNGGFFSLKGFGAGFLILLIPFMMGYVGGGDVKLFAGLGAWLGISGVLNLALYSSIAGGILALGLILVAMGPAGILNFILFPRGRGPILPARVRRQGIPYSVPMAAGYAVYIAVGPAIQSF